MGQVAPIRLGVLGDVVVRDRQGAEAPLAPQRLHILAVLAAAAGSVVARTDLVHDVWGNDSEAARQRLKSQIAQIRAVLDDELAITFRLDGYRLAGSLDQLDSTRFESLVTGARSLDPAAAASRYRDALALWRGPAFSGVDSVLVDDARRRLDILRDNTMLALARCEAQLGQPGSSLEWLRAALDADPARGDVALLAATLLALSGRQAESLRQIERHRTALVAIGLEPAAELVELEVRILRHELTPTTGAATAEERTPGAAGHGPTRAGQDGRGPERPVDRIVARPVVEKQIIAGLADRPVVLVGEAGVGKSVQAGLVADLFSAAGSPVLRTAARPDPTRPMEVVADLVDILTGTLDPDRPEVLGARPTTVAALGRVTGRQVPGAPSISRDELIGELTDVIRTGALACGGLVVVEDAHWLDNSSAEILGRLLEPEGGLPRPPMLLTSRRAPGDLFGASWGGAVTIDVPPLGIDEVRELVQHVLPVRASADLARRLHERTGGNGLFLRLELDLLADGRLGQELQPSVLHAVHERTSGFSRATRELLHTAALLGQVFPLDPLAALHPNHRVILDDAVEEGLIRLDPDGATGAFVHGLVAEAFVELQPPAVRVNRHDQLWAELHRLGAPAAALAKQALGARDLDPARAVAACISAARAEAEVFDWAAAVEWARLGLDAIERSGLADEPSEAALHLLAGRGLRRMNLPGSELELRLASDQAETIDDPALYLECVTELCLHGGTTRAGSVDLPARGHLERALAIDADHRLRAELMSTAATLMTVSDEAERGRDLYHRALELARDTGHPETLRTVLLNAHLGLGHPDDLPLRRWSMAALGDFDDHTARWESRYLAVGLALMEADRAAFDAAVADLRTLTAAVRESNHAKALGVIECVAAFVEGRLDEAGRLADEAFRVNLEIFPESWAASIYAALLLPIREAEGRAGELLDTAMALVLSNPTFVTWHAMAAIVAHAAGADDVMAEQLEAVAAGGFSLVPDLTWTAVATELCRPVAAHGDPAMIAALGRQLTPHAGRMSWNGLSTHGPVSGGLALLEAVSGRSPTVEGRLSAARAQVERFGALHLWWPELERLAQERYPHVLPHLG